MYWFQNVSYDVIIMKKLYSLGHGELLMFSRDEERGAFEFYAGVEEGTERWGSKNLGNMIEIESEVVNFGNEFCDVALAGENECWFVKFF